MAPDDRDVAATVLALLAQRADDATICPSEAARTLAPEGWRALMPQVRAVAVRLALSGRLTIRQRGRVVAPDGPLRGPIRLGRPLPR